MLSKLKQAGAERVVLVAVLLGIIIFIGWTALILTIAAVLRLTGAQPDIWSMFEGLSSAAAFALAVGGGIVALVQINESIDSRNLSVFNDVFQRLMSDEEIHARRWIYTQLEGTPEQMASSLSDSDRDRIKRVLNTFDYLGFLIQQGWVSNKAREDIIGFVMPIVVKTWLKIGPFVEYESSRRNDEDYYRSAQYLAMLCHRYHGSHMDGGAEYIFIEDAL